ncbi:glycosyltransferase family 4 protein [Candidatus Venteria ishoeyi]|uniref:glycosyltransferase family 4 protein n=1 Tax=Candidatus Venteria ishoeyi TaxID=1899563 RepID=UPI0025A5540B|nr:glycosyltransferase family 4 protein [Candidatus Venteria ishoeyi]MDM8544991.1 glycosyltransferase family 4 protein [Candidatus Venteria ishoeyi]
MQNQKIMKNNQGIAILKQADWQLEYNPEPNPGSNPGSNLESQPVLIVVIAVETAVSVLETCLHALISHTPTHCKILVLQNYQHVEQAIWQALRQTITVTDLHCDDKPSATLQHIVKQHPQQDIVVLDAAISVTPNWLALLQQCAHSDAQIALVGVLSNDAGWQSVPTLPHQHPAKALPLDMDSAQMAQRLRATSCRIYPRLPYLDPACILLKAQARGQLGPLAPDLATIPMQLLEYSLRAQAEDLTSVVADDVWLYAHAPRPTTANPLMHPALLQRFTEPLLLKQRNLCRDSRVMAGLRARTQVLLKRWNYIESALFRWQGKKIMIILPLRETGGGSHVIVSEAQVLRRMGVDIQLLNFYGHQQDFEACYPDLEVPVCYVHHESDIPEACQNFDAVIASVFFTVPWLQALLDFPNPPKIAYYVQDFEPWFFIDKASRLPGFWSMPALRRRLAGYYFRRSEDFRAAWLSYLHIPDIQLLTKTRWNQQELSAMLGKNSQVIGASYQSDIFMPLRERAEHDKLRISAMIRPATPRRAAALTMQVLAKIQRAYPQQVEIVLFGVDANDPALASLSRDFEHQHLGLLSPAQLVTLFNDVDIFVDFSRFQAMGLTAMEAMACGVAVIVPEAGGSGSFVRHGKNALQVNSQCFPQCYQALQQLIEQSALRQRLAQQAIMDMPQFHPEAVAWKLLAQLFS